jgi:3',5'-cyclic AMP phosphodiesterase CpdA
MFYFTPLTFAGDSPVNVWIMDTQGKYGLPNLGASFWTHTPQQLTCAWGNAEESFVLEDEGKTQQHTFLFQHLKPTKAYWFSINGDNYSFVTPSTNSITFGLGGDAHIRKQDQTDPIFATLLQKMTDHNLDYFFLLGDLVDRGFSASEWQTGLNILANYTVKMPTAFVMGNHDALLNGKIITKNYVIPDDFAWASPTPLYRKISIGDWCHIFLLDVEWFDDATFSAAQEAWLRSELTTVNKTDWTFILTHANPLGSLDAVYEQLEDMNQNYEEIYNPKL